MKHPIPEVSAESVAPMEAVLDLYEEAYDPRYPTVCFDEKLVAPEANVRPPEPMQPGQPERVDYEFEQLGTANLFFNALSPLFRLHIYIMGPRQMNPFILPVN